MSRLKVGLAAAILAHAIAGPTAGAAFGGEITGGPHPKFTPVHDHLASSICSFSGQEDGLTLTGFDPVTGAPIIIEVPTGPGLVQTPHMENSAGIIHAPGISGTACRGNGGGEA
jgi:hypothetical protein